MQIHIAWEVARTPSFVHLAVSLQQKKNIATKKADNPANFLC